MILSIVVSTNGPYVEKHEVSEIGAAIYESGEKISQFGSFVRPECIDFSHRSHIQRMGIRSLSDYQERARFLEPFYQVWGRFVSWCLRHSNYENFSAFCSEVVWVGHNLDAHLLFLDKEARFNEKDFRYGDVIKKVDLNTLTTVMEKIAHYKGYDKTVDKSLESVCNFYNVPLTDVEDAGRRAIAIGAVFYYHLAQEKEVYGL